MSVNLLRYTSSCISYQLLTINAQSIRYCTPFPLFGFCSLQLYTEHLAELSCVLLRVYTTSHSLCSTHTAYSPSRFNQVQPVQHNPGCSLTDSLRERLCTHQPPVLTSRHRSLLLFPSFVFLSFYLPPTVSSFSSKAHHAADVCPKGSTRQAHTAGNCRCRKIC